jgi:hypothetical protein
MEGNQGNRLQKMQSHFVIKYEASFNDAQFSDIATGLVPQRMEDRWLAFYENDTLYVHRSWLGTPIYEIYFSNLPGIHRIKEVRVNADKKEYVSSGIKDEKKTIEVIFQLLKEKYRA